MKAERSRLSTVKQTVPEHAGSLGESEKEEEEDVGLLITSCISKMAIADVRMAGGEVFAWRGERKAKGGIGQVQKSNDPEETRECEPKKCTDFLISVYLYIFVY